MNLTFSFSILDTIFFAQIQKKKEIFLLKKGIKETKKIYHTFIGNVHDPVIIINNRSLHYSNTAAAQKIGIASKRDFEKFKNFFSSNGKTIWEYLEKSFIRNDDSKKNVFQEKFFEYREDNEILHHQNVWLVTMVESKLTPTLSSVALVFVNFSSQLHDEKKKIEEKYKNVLFFSLSHELRTPLNIIQSFMHLAKRLVGKPEEIDSWSNAKGAWKYLRNKINDALDYSQLLSGEFVIHKIKFSLRKFVQYLKKATVCMLLEKKAYLIIKELLSFLRVKFSLRKY